VEMFRDAGSIPAASTRANLRASRKLALRLRFREFLKTTEMWTIPTRFLFAIVFAGLGAVLLWKSLTSQRLTGALIVGWLSLDLFFVSIAYLRQNSRVFGKTDNGTMRPLPAIIMGPFLCFTWLVWRLQNLFSREPIWNEVMPGLFVGRRCSFDCLPPNATTVIDLTAEFPTPGKIRRYTKVVCIPTLDGCSPNQADCLRLFDRFNENDDAVLYVHCANGHARSVTFVAGLLTKRGITNRPDAALQKLKQCRPRASPNADQRRFLHELLLCHDAREG
jgi:hypothetical protein